MRLNSPLWLGSEPVHQFMCSRAGCSAQAEWALRWSNPAIHRNGRKKIWLACSDHRGVLRDFLSARGFPLEVVSVEDLDG